MIEKVLFLATLNKVLIDYFSEPIKQKYPNLDLWWLLYVAGLTGLAMGLFSELNLFPTLFPNVIVGRVMTSILVGGGSSLIHKLFEGGVGALRSIVAKNWEQAAAYGDYRENDNVTVQFVTRNENEPIS